MGKIIRNGITYGGGSDELIQCTQAQYDAWEQAGTIDPTKLYCITDASSGSSLIDDSTTSQSKTWSSDKIDDQLDLKANASSTYTKSEVDSALSNKANTSSILNVVAIHMSDLSVVVPGGTVRDLFYNQDISSYLPSEAKLKAIIVEEFTPSALIVRQWVNSDTKCSIRAGNAGNSITITDVYFRALYTLS